MTKLNELWGNFKALELEKKKSAIGTGVGRAGFIAGTAILAVLLYKAKIWEAKDKGAALKILKDLLNKNPLFIFGIIMLAAGAAVFLAGIAGLIMNSREASKDPSLETPKTEGEQSPEVDSTIDLNTTAPAANTITDTQPLVSSVTPDAGTSGNQESKWSRTSGKKTKAAAIVGGTSFIAGALSIVGLMYKAGFFNAKNSAEQLNILKGLLKNPLFITALIAVGAGIAALLGATIGAIVNSRETVAARERDALMSKIWVEDSSILPGGYTINYLDLLHEHKHDPTALNTAPIIKKESTEVKASVSSSASRPSGAPAAITPATPTSILDTPFVDTQLTTSLKPTPLPTPVSSIPLSPATVSVPSATSSLGISADSILEKDPNLLPKDSFAPTTGSSLNSEDLEQKPGTVDEILYKEELIKDIAELKELNVTLAQEIASREAAKLQAEANELPSISSAASSSSKHSLVSEQEEYKTPPASSHTVTTLSVSTEAREVNSSLTTDPKENSLPVTPSIDTEAALADALSAPGSASPVLTVLNVAPSTGALPIVEVPQNAPPAPVTIGAAEEKPSVWKRFKKKIGIKDDQPSSSVASSASNSPISTTPNSSGPLSPTPGSTGSQGLAEETAPIAQVVDLGNSEQATQDNLPAPQTIVSDPTVAPGTKNEMAK